MLIILQRNETGDISQHMEKEGLVRCLNRLTSIHVAKIVTDIHTSINAMFNHVSRHSTHMSPRVKRNSFDMWHARKGSFLTEF